MREVTIDSRYNSEAMLLRTVILSIALAAGLTAADSLVEQAKKQVAEKKYDEAIAQLQTAYKAKATPERRKALAEANMAKAEDFMYNESVPPRVRYPTALRAYREVLKYDKDNTKAQQSIATIENIYKQMGRPIPQ